MAYTINDRRHNSAKKEATEACRVCGSSEVHTREYNKPTMLCIGYLRQTISDLEKNLLTYKTLSGM
ncbi:MAG: hypothetical protein WC511_01980 [Candidatus Pacearchaeota archaeon]